MEIVIAVLVLAVIVLAREYMGERRWRMDVETEVVEWRRADRDRLVAAEQAQDEAQFAADAAAWGER
ncbi:MAG TPA: hypothetical protein PKW63_14870 [Vicinamibacterales bacterium]|nr:hypothetical protein [Vicinamibacterales bacterium]HQZ41057.1 hypothetical protein [Vicinamibacterales bacterium]